MLFHWVSRVRVKFIACRTGVIVLPTQSTGGKCEARCATCYACLPPLAPLLLLYLAYVKFFQYVTRRFYESNATAELLPLKIVAGGTRLIFIFSLFFFFAPIPPSVLLIFLKRPKKRKRKKKERERRRVFESSRVNITCDVNLFSCLVLQYLETKKCCRWAEASGFSFGVE